MDVIIVGAGVAGLRAGIKILTDHPTKKCVILEKYNYNGGRVITYHHHIPGVGKVQWENGAGRIASTHKKVLGLLRHYGLTTYPISSDVGYVCEPGIMQPNRFLDLHDLFIEPLRSLPLDLLQTHTLAQVSEMVLGTTRTRELYAQFPYFSEIHTLRADHAIYVFDYEMGSMSGFFGCAEGLSALIDGMVNEFQSLGGSILHDQEVVVVSSLPEGIRIRCKNDTYEARTCIMALHSEAMKHIRGVSHLPVLDKLVMNPLLRMYAVFPLKKGKSWFSDLPKIVTNDPIRYIIPISDRSIMISYTDGDDARFWMRKSSAAREKEVMKHIRTLFPTCAVPDPIFFKSHAWTSGCTYWKPGRYNIQEESDRSLHPDPIKMPRLFLCGESFAVLQCWMECAIEQTDRLIDLPAFRKAVA